MTQITIEIENETYQKLEAVAQKAGKKPDDLTRALIEKALQKPAISRSIKSVLKEKGRIRLQDNVTQNDIPSLESVCNALGNAGGPSLESLIDQQRGSKM